jgi:AraC family transcriptional activator of pobA
VIPTINLPLIHKQLNGVSSDQKYLLHRFSIDNAPVWEACRMDVYFIAFLHKGKVLIESDLTEQEVEGPAVFAMAPSVIRKFVAASKDFLSEVIFFDKGFLLQQLTDQTYLDNYEFFNTHNDHLITLKKQHHSNFQSYFKLLRKQDGKPERYADNITRNIIQILLSEIAAININEGPKKEHSYKEYLTILFKRNLEVHYQRHRKVNFYAQMQNLSSKYFSHLIQTVSGKSAGELIDERVILEARALLNNKALTIAQISSTLGFSDASNFGKYFKHLTGESPLLYRKSRN